MMALLDLAPQERPTGVIAFNDVSPWVLCTQRAHGDCACRMTCPHRRGRYLCCRPRHPPLTTISQPKYRMGALAVQTLRRMSQGQIDTATAAPAGESADCPRVHRPAPQNGLTDKT